MKALTLALSGLVIVLFFSFVLSKLLGCRPGVLLCCLVCCLKRTLVLNKE